MKQSGTTTGQLLSVGEEGIELSEEIQDEPYGEAAVSDTPAMASR
jgi:hypothetical protein